MLRQPLAAVRPFLAAAQREGEASPEQVDIVDPERRPLINNRIRGAIAAASHRRQ